MPALYRCVDLMVLPSTGEGFPLAAQEAMSSAVPLIVLWDSGYSGSLSREVVAACDSIEGVHRNVRALVASPSLRDQIGKAGRRWAEEHWSWPRTADHFDSLYGYLLTRGRPDARTSA
jgi:glycosyltransferase involved in cell wall biosynthesis